MQCYLGDQIGGGHRQIAAMALREKRAQRRVSLFSPIPMGDSFKLLKLRLVGQKNSGG